MLVNTKEILLDAQKNKYAVPAFSVYNLEITQAALHVAEREQHPLILAVGERYFSTLNIEGFSSLIRTFAHNTSVPVALHLDHAYKKESILRAIRNGFSSVMFDGSSHPFDENVRLTKEMTEISHLAGISIEAEIGSLARGAFSDEEEGSGALTDPLLAAEFVKETNVDFLAAAIGTVHGLYVSKPHINLELLEQIKSKVDIPLVLHGGSDTPEEIIRKVIERGICKININTDVSVQAMTFLKNAMKAGTYLHLSNLMEDMQEVMETCMTDMVRICKGNN
ncbi:class II fructose-bisphosphate aldolase [Sporosarcina newyorkensis]|uniref:Fructose-bisphosphate aldolase, class II n=1 Tax=Sporosarcina newyorkensis TaxID=759851 RepID=A0A1T4YV37_9BACL|nr:class II fructose-bisphosphate aldolase [Sporosarcina newyorkensis]SKB05576.1 fructose-bisphosphate aldolase, class II [Sporosarcina newyorkensis]